MPLFKRNFPVVLGDTGIDPYTEDTKEDVKETLYEIITQNKAFHNKPFFDTSFKPTFINLICKSIQETKFIQKNQEWKKIVWRRPSEFMKSNYKLFNRSFFGSDIKQGELMDSHFLLAVQLILQFPYRIKRLFVNTKKSKTGAYIVRLYDTGHWKDVLIDD